jgi:predicted GIY-YIG superfamily endonuclease
MTQLLLFPDPRPLVDRLGQEFFRQAPETPGVYLMRDASDAVVYVGKAKNLRKRLASYRVANPDRLRRRHLRLLRSVVRIELERCLDESDALSRESQLLRQLRPRFNRAGTWPGPPRFLASSRDGEGLHLAVTTAVEPGWIFQGPLGAGAFSLRAALVRLLWRTLLPDIGLETLPHRWFQTPRVPLVTLPAEGFSRDALAQAQIQLALLANQGPEPFLGWVEQRTASPASPFERALRDLDLEVIRESVVKSAA